ncbi:SDR family NAD(P)-dependent oxidoreductase [Sandaracinus amylolyticus]|uniref:Short-chain dehydrogenase/reductase SDR n=1 Tax=Sandaracinus amylolyticus TaxID=927083 RepID=A0A0F6SEJ3_9BACT|nr:SDR family NAD(P)-dependent oxidoreductase [Sandaracinus amylolyticus]AKF05294.1 short-chain dehydrogenase/reductase SDR [Sandaracinus amylolyticus]
MTKHWQDQVAWITGAGSGIGRALAIELGRQGAIVAVSGRRQQRLEEVAREVEAAGGRALAVPCDVTEESDVVIASSSIVRELGRLDLAIANAGFSVAGAVRDLSAEDWRRQLDTNVIGAAMTARHALPHLERTQGRIALVGSVSALLPTPRMAAYTASKYALRAIGQTLSIELDGTGVSCTLVHPGFVESEIAQVDNQGRHDPARVDKRPKNLMWPADRAAREMLRAIRARKREHVFTGHGKLGAALGQHAPGIAHFVMTRGAAKRQAAAVTKNASSSSNDR